MPVGILCRLGYDAAGVTVQSGFMGGVSIIPKTFGLRGPQSEIDDWVYAQTNKHTHARARTPMHAHAHMQAHYTHMLTRMHPGTNSSMHNGQTQARALACMQPYGVGLVFNPLH